MPRFQLLPLARALCRPVAAHGLPLSLALASSICCGQAHADDELAPLTATAQARPASEARLDASRGQLDRSARSDAADLLRQVPGMSLSSAGGLSALPVLRGMADDRLRVRVNGVDLQAACPNHMNPATSYIAPAAVQSVSVQAGAVSVVRGGDSLGGAIELQSAPPAFAASGEPALVTGQAGAFYRSNGDARGGHLQASWAREDWSLSYQGSTAKAGNWDAAHDFKPAAQGAEFGRVLSGKEVGSTAHHFVNNDLGLAWRHEAHLLRFNVGEQRVFYEGFPNQRMDMTDNHNTLFNARYEGELDWGTVEARLSAQRTRHEMDMGPDRYQYGYGMPMLTQADTDSGLLGVTVPLDAQDTIKAGAEFLRYTLYDWWPPVGASGAMAPDAFWNIDLGRRNRLGAYAEWTRQWAPQWQSQLGVRRERVLADAAKVQGYNSDASWADDAVAFNARSHRHVDQNLDFSAQLRHQPEATTSYAWGYARQTRSPSLYQRFPWSTNSMAALMNNFVGDGNGYVGNEGLRPEVAHTVNMSGQWRSKDAGLWLLKANAYLTRVDGHIDAQRCTVGACGSTYVNTQQGFVLLQYVNQDARITGLDLSGEALVARPEGWGRLDVQGVLNLLRGSNLRTGEPLYNMMPTNATLALVQHLNGWQHTVEWVGVAGKHRVSAVRNEMPTSGYSLWNLRTSRVWPQAQLDLGVDNAFNHFYRQPLGGAYVGQGASMSTTGIAWGQVLPGAGRSVSVALTLKY